MIMSLMKPARHGIPCKYIDMHIRVRHWASLFYMRQNSTKLPLKTYTQVQ